MYELRDITTGSNTVTGEIGSDDPHASFYIDETQIKPDQGDKLIAKTRGRTPEDLIDRIRVEDPINAPGVIAVAEGVRLVCTNSDDKTQLWRGPKEILEVVPSPDPPAN